LERHTNILKKGIHLGIAITIFPSEFTNDSLTQSEAITEKEQTCDFYEIETAQKKRDMRF
jgi:hypothetical protein